MSSVEKIVDEIVTPPQEISFDTLAASQRDTLELLKTVIANLKTQNMYLAKLAKASKIQQTKFDKQQRKELAKKEKKEANASGKPKTLNGFAKPVLVSDDLYNFLAQFGVEKGTLVSRTDVVQFFTRYIKGENPQKTSLQDQNFKREFVPDSTLQALLTESTDLRDKKLPASDSNPFVFMFITLQKCLAHHFPETAKAKAAKAAAADA